MKSITLNLTNYTCKGIADLTPWGGGNACIEMQSFNVKSIFEIQDNLNDNGFGVESINGAVVDVYRNYQGTLRFARTLFLGDISEHTMDTYYS